MKEQEFKKEIERLICVFNAPKNYGPLMLQCYYEALTEISVDELKRVVSLCISNEYAFPLPVTMRSYAHNLSQPQPNVK